MPESTRLPAGTILGPDGKPCRVCSSFRNWKPAVDARELARTSSAQSRNGSMNSRQNTSDTAVTAVASLALTKAAHPCPPDASQLGSATWTFLHTTAAYYPSKPSPAQRANMLSLIYSLPLLYPCRDCAEDFGRDLEAHKPTSAVRSREDLSKWFCERHNEVNRKLGKEVWDCGVEKMDERWKDGPGDGRCDD
ncbi:FAD-dependent thiol oxidase [Gymnopus androsaceus JB14]|uniref:Sulfhydryl oxidase n=1 Tax=Gymnopus androsaceus JB14 TaxID=1447944 RepID=A0A6A4H845_9AGAR|nr:FAD-dependent thiol oxidase [Gymnopus androsaceus JB14]